MNLPNKLSLTRILLIPVIVLFYLLSGVFAYGKLVALILFCLAVFTDFLDGYIARKFNLITTLGTFLDTIADKMLVISVLSLLVSDGSILAPYGVIALIVVVCRELLVSALRQIAASKNVVISADMWGKLKANFQFFMIMFFLLFAFLNDVCVLSEAINLALNILCYLLLALTVVATILSCVHYLIKDKNVFKTENKDKM